MLNRSLNSSLRHKEATPLGNVSDFNFLMQSMERQKQNLNGNLTASSTTIDFGERTSKRQANKISSLIMDPQQQQLRASIGFMPKHSPTLQIDTFLKKVQNYITICTTLMEVEQPKANSSLQKQMNKIGDQVQYFIDSYRKQHTTAPFFNNVSLRKSLNVKCFEGVSKIQQGSTYKRIKQLQLENERLNSLVQQHQNTNIKMHIKINSLESSQIQKCKKQLQNEYEAYKQLQLKVKEYKQRVRQLQKQKQVVSKQCCFKQTIIGYLQQKISQSQQNSTKKDNTASLQEIVVKQQKQMEVLYAKIRKYQSNEQRFVQEIQKLRKKSKGSSRTNSQCSQCSKQSRTLQERQNDIVQFMLLQAKTIEELHRHTK